MSFGVACARRVSSRARDRGSQQRRARVGHNRKQRSCFCQDECAHVAPRRHLPAPSVDIRLRLYGRGRIRASVETRKPLVNVRQAV